MANSFNLEQFKNGVNAINGIGQEVKFVTETRGKLFVRVMGKFGRTENMKVNLDGKMYVGVDNMFDLVAMKEAA